MSTPVKNMLVGVFILGAIALLVSIILFLKPTVGDGKQALHVRFSNINGLNVGTRVLFGGKPVGEVVAMEEIEDARAQPTDELGRVYFYELILHIDSKVKVYNTDEISIQSSGLMGERSIAITPKSPPKGVVSKQITSHPIYADSIDPFQNVMLDFSDLAAQMEETFRHASTWIKNHGEEVASTLRATGSAMGEIDQAVASYNQLDLIHDLKHGSQNLTVIMENLKSASHSVEQVAAGLSQGKGSLGKLVADNDFYLQLSAILTKGNHLMNDVNHYGILFHLNKQWQRTHLQRINQLNALKKPEAFRNYFQNEVDDINASMTRLSLLLEKAEHTEIFQTKTFQNDFAELLRRSEELSEHLRLYNLQLQEGAK